MTDAKGLRQSLCHHLTHELLPLHRQTMLDELELFGPNSDEIPTATVDEWAEALDGLIECGGVAAAGGRVQIVRGFSLDDEASGQRMLF